MSLFICWVFPPFFCTNKTQLGEEEKSPILEDQTSPLECVCNHYKLLWSSTENTAISRARAKENKLLTPASKCLILNIRTISYQEVSRVLHHYLFKISEYLDQRARPDFQGIHLNPDVLVSPGAKHAVRFPLSTRWQMVPTTSGVFWW